MTSLANPTIHSRPNPQIVPGIWMPRWAVSFTSINRRPSFAAEHVLSLRCGPEMLRINTGSVSAQVVNNQAFWYGAVECFVGKAMRYVTPVFHHDLGVAVTAKRLCPDPAAAFINCYGIGNFDYGWLGIVALASIAHHLLHQAITRFISMASRNSWALICGTTSRIITSIARLNSFSNPA